MPHTIKMSLKLMLFVAFLIAVTSEGKPYRGYPLPFYPNYTNEASEAPVNSAPWQASLQWGLTKYTHFCGGAILSTRWVITSAHCVLVVPSYGNFVVIVGKQNLKIVESTQQAVYVEKSIVHEKYSGEAGPYDLAVLKLSTALRYTSAIAAVSLPPSGIIPTGTATLTGWGSTWRTYTPIMPDKLQVIQVQMIDYAACKRAVEALVGTSPLYSGNVCAGPLNGGFTSCNADPGGPLIKKNGTTVNVLVGIVSWGIVPCGTSGAPSIYTRISDHINWINNAIRL